jgi:hypothetical protein
MNLGHHWNLRLRGHLHRRLWQVGMALNLLDTRWSSVAIHGWLSVGCWNLQLSLTHYT